MIAVVPAEALQGNSEREVVCFRRATLSDSDVRRRTRSFAEGWEAGPRGSGARDAD